MMKQKHKMNKPAKVEDEEDATKLDNMYCTQEIGKILHSSTIEELENLGLKEDVSVSYTKIVFMLLLSSIGTYSAIFTSAEKSKYKLLLTVIAFFLLFGAMTIYDKVVMRGATFRLKLDDKDKVYVWCTVNWKNATCDIAYSFSDRAAKRGTYEIPLCEMFFEDGKLDEEYYRKSMAQLYNEIKAARSKKLA